MVRKTLVASLSVAALLVAAAAYGEGLDVTYGKGLPDFDLKGKTFKVLKKGVLKSGESVELKDVLFEENAKAIAIGIGKGDDSDLDLFVTDSKGGGLIGSDTLLDNIPVVEWNTGAKGRLVNIRASNAGKADCEYILLANW
jgi:hypothetical protein